MTDRPYRFICEMANEHQQAVEDLFWDWYQVCRVEMWEKEQWVRLNDDAQRRAALLGVEFKVRFPHDEARRS